MKTNPQLNTFGIIASTIDIPNITNGIVDQVRKFGDLPIREIEVELDSIVSAVEYCSNDSQMITAVMNYPLGGYQPEYILDLIRWVGKKNIGRICIGLPLFWLRSNETARLENFISELMDACGEKTLRISFESELLSENEISSICKLICDAGVSHVKSSCGFSHKTSAENISFIRKKYPDLILTVDNDLRGDSPEIDELLQSGVRYVCVKEPWLYHF